MFLPRFFIGKILKYTQYDKGSQAFNGINGDLF